MSEMRARLLARAFDEVDISAARLAEYLLVDRGTLDRWTHSPSTMPLMVCAAVVEFLELHERRHPQRLELARLLKRQVADDLQSAVVSAMASCGGLSREQAREKLRAFIASPAIAHPSRLVEWVAEAERVIVEPALQRLYGDDARRGSA